MKTKINVKAGYSDRLLIKPVEFPDLQLDPETKLQGGFYVKTGQTVSAILE